MLNGFRFHLALHRQLSGGLLALTLATGSLGVGCSSGRPASVPPAAPATVTAPSAVPTERYVGAYTLRHGDRTLDVRVYHENGQLMAQATGQGPSALLARGDHAFVLGVDDRIRLVFSGDGARSESVTLYQNGREFPGTRNS